MLSASSRALQYAEGFQWVKKHLLRAWQWKCPACSQLTVTRTPSYAALASSPLRDWSAAGCHCAWCQTWSRWCSLLQFPHPLAACGVLGALHPSPWNTCRGNITQGEHYYTGEHYSIGGTLLHRGTLLNRGNIITQGGGGIIIQGNHHYTGTILNWGNIITQKEHYYTGELY